MYCIVVIYGAIRNHSFICPQCDEIGLSGNHRSCMGPVGMPNADMWRRHGQWGRGGALGSLEVRATWRCAGRCAEVLWEVGWRCAGR